MFSSKNNKKINISGFTLIEIMTSVAIIALLMGVFLTNYQAGKKRSDIVFAAQQLASDVRTAQNNAVGTVSFNGSVSLGGWGVNFIKNDNYYTIFADTDEERDFDSPAEEYNIIDLPNDIVINDIFVVDSGDATTTATSVDVTFEPPDPTVYLDGFGCSQNKRIVIELKKIDEVITRRISINCLGLIEILD